MTETKIDRSGQDVIVRASLDVLGLKRRQVETVTWTPLIQGALDGGKLVELVWHDGELVPAYTLPPADGEWYACPSCMIERTDYLGPDKHLDQCPNCGSDLPPIPNQLIGVSGTEITAPTYDDLAKSVD